jgi:hypothetical protein
MSFKSFKFLNELSKKLIIEAETENENNEDNKNATEDIDNTEDVSEGSEKVEGNPEITPDVEDGIFISDIKKAEWTKLMLQALMTEKPETGAFNDDLMNVTTENVDAVINEIKNYIKLKDANSDLDAVLNNMI